MIDSGLKHLQPLLRDLVKQLVVSILAISIRESCEQKENNCGLGYVIDHSAHGVKSRFSRFFLFYQDRPSCF